MHKMPPDALPDGEKAPTRMKTDHGSPEQQAETGAYRLDGPTSELYLPAEAIYQAMVKAATSYKLAGARGKTYKDAIKGEVSVEPESIGLGTSTYVVDARTAKVQGKSCRRYRPRLDTWRAEFAVQVFTEALVTAEALEAILAHAGQTVGLLDYRPRFGRFRIEEFKEA
jgi:hypothetical protein